MPAIVQTNSGGTIEQQEKMSERVARVLFFLGATEVGIGESMALNDVS